MREINAIQPSINLLRFGKTYTRYFFSTDESLPERCFECVEYLALEGEEAVREEVAMRYYLFKINTIGLIEHYGEVSWTGDPKKIYDYDYLFSLVSLDPSPKVRLSLLKKHYQILIERGFLRVPYLIPVYALDENPQVRKLFWEQWYKYVFSIGKHYGLDYINLSKFFPDVKKEQERWDRWIYLYDEDRERYKKLLYEGDKEEVTQLLLRPDVGLFDVENPLRMADKSIVSIFRWLPSYRKFLSQRRLIGEEELSKILSEEEEDIEEDVEKENTVIETENYLLGVNIARAREIVEKAFSKRVRQLPERKKEVIKYLMQI